MKKKRSVITFIFILFTIITSSLIVTKNVVLADSHIDVSVDKDKIQKGQTVEVTVSTGNVNVYSLTLQIYFDITKLEYVNQTENSNFSQNRVIYTWTDDNLKEKTVEKTEKFTFKALQDGSANIIVTGEFYDKEGNQIIIQDGVSQVTIGTEEKIQSEINNDTDNEKKQEQVSSDNTNLKIMRLNREGISPDFQKSVKEYYFIADNSINDLEVTAIPENANATVNVTGNTNLKKGLNTIKIEVESEDKTKKSVYAIHVTKTENPELANSNLENLAVREAMLFPAFDANITQYDIEVANDIDKIDVLAVPEKIGATVTINGNDKLEIGGNIITVNVTAENKITNKKYVIKAHRRDEQEEIQAKEEQENQVEQLEAILEEQSEENRSTERYEENTSKMEIIDVITWGLLGTVAVGFIIAFIVHVILKRNKGK